MVESLLSSDFPQGYKGPLQLKCPLKSRINPHQNATEQHLMQWVIAFRLIPETPLSLEKFKAWRFANLAARTYPHLGRAQLDIVTDLTAILFLSDDLLDTPETGNPKYEKKLRMWEDRGMEICFGAVPQETDHPLNVALGDVMKRMRGLTDSAWVHRFAVHFREAVLGVRWERTTRNDWGIRSLATYTKMRRLTIAALASFDLIGMFTRAELNYEPAEYGLVKELVCMAANYIGWTNDVYSVKKEVHQGITDNLVIVLKSAKGCGWAEAIDAAVEMCNKEMEAFLLLEGRLEAVMGELDAGTVEFVEGLKHFIRGHVGWFADTARYSS